MTLSALVTRIRKIRTFKGINVIYGTIICWMMFSIFNALACITIGDFSFKYLRQVCRNRVRVAHNIQSTSFSISINPFQWCDRIFFQFISKIKFTNRSRLSVKLRWQFSFDVWGRGNTPDENLPIVVSYSNFTSNWANPTRGCHLFLFMVEWLQHISASCMDGFAFSNIPQCNKAISENNKNPAKIQGNLRDY